MTSKEFEEERNLFHELTFLDDDNILDMAREKPYLQSQYINKYNDSLEKLLVLKIELDKLYADVYRETKFNAKNVWNTKGEIETQMFADEKYYNKKKEYEFQKMVTDFYSDAVDTIKNMGFDIKNYIEYKKFLLGS